MQVGVFLLVVLLQSLEEESSGLNINEGTSLGVDQSLGKMERSLWVVEKELGQHRGVIHFEPDASGVWHNFVSCHSFPYERPGLGLDHRAPMSLMVAKDPASGKSS